MTQKNHRRHDHDVGIKMLETCRKKGKQVENS